jgi:hypothetical protein
LERGREAAVSKGKVLVSAKKKVGKKKAHDTYIIISLAFFKKFFHYFLEHTDVGRL